MRIKNITLLEKENVVILQATCDIRYFGSDTLYFAVNKKYQDFLYTDASPFAAALLLPAMKRGENLVIEGAISENLYHGMQRCIDLVVGWGLGLKPIEIQASKLIKDTQTPLYIASFFSGGVDSFYTYLKHKHNQDGALSYFILVNGYDIDLKNKSLWQKTLTDVKKIAEHEKINVIDVESNVRILTDPIFEWDYTFSAGLAAIGLLLRNKIKKVYRASSYSHAQRSGAMDMVIDNYFDTEKLSIVHDGGESNRLEKVLAISQSQLVLDNLRVCYVNQKDTYNCGVCDKCLRTMINLFIAGKLTETKTFTKTIDLELVKKLTIDNEHGAIFHRENLNELKKRHLAPELQDVIEGSLNNFAQKPVFLENLKRQLVTLDFQYSRGYIRKLFGNSPEN